MQTVAFIFGILMGMIIVALVFIITELSNKKKVKSRTITYNFSMHESQRIRDMWFASCAETATLNVKCLSPNGDYSLNFQLSYLFTVSADSIDVCNQEINRLTDIVNECKGWPKIDRAAKI